MTLLATETALDSLAGIVLMVAFALPASGAGATPRLLHASAADTIHAVAAEHGMVVAQEKIAARIGADVLRRGGNAVDAAVATGFAMAVTYPRAGNIGGGGFMVIHSAERHEDVAIDYRETAPAATTPRDFSRARRQARYREVARFRARHRRSRHGRGIDAGAGEIRLGQIHAGRSAAAGDRAGARRLCRHRRHRRHAAGLASAAGALAIVGENLFPCRRHLAARGRPAGSDRSGGDAGRDCRTGPARILRGSGRGKAGRRRLATPAAS